jgi:hypothetical protein
MNGGTAAWIDRLERRAGFLEVPNLAAFMSGMNALTAALTLIKPEFPAQLVLDPFLLRAGQVWRALTFVLVPPDLAPLWLVFWLVLYFSYLSSLEQAWGDFKLTLYVLIGALATAAACALSGAALGSGAFVTSLFLAFARNYPDTQILLFFVIPVRMKWLAGAVWAMSAWTALFGGWDERVSLAAGLLNYVLFFGPAHAAELQQAWRAQRRRR